ncbi:MAG: HNH endonuclease [Thermodesulfovibrionales bacterium]
MFERKLNFKPKAKLVGELLSRELICSQLGAAPFLSIKLTEAGYVKQRDNAILLNNNFCCYKDEIILSYKPILPFEVKDAIKKSTAIIVGKISNRELIFNVKFPPDVYFQEHWPTTPTIKVFIPEDKIPRQLEAPLFVGSYDSDKLIPCFVFRNKIVAIDGIQYFHVTDSTIFPEEDLLMVKHFVLKQEKAFEKMKSQVEAFEKFEKLMKSSREPISEEVRMYVWRRDAGKCVKCDSQRNLEFDHIIPVAKGGSNTERNIQLLCEACNRQKSDII